MSKMSGFCDQLAKQVIKQAAPDPLTGFLLVSFIDLLKEEHESVDQKVDKLIASYYLAGKSYLEDARLVSGERRQRWIEEASNEFRKASTVENPLKAAKAMFFVGVCYAMLGEQTLALNWYEKSYQAAHAIESQLVTKSKPSSVEGGAVIVLLTGVYGAAYLGYRYQQKKRARNALAELRDFLMPLSNLLRAWNSRLPTLQTADEREKTYYYLHAALPRENQQGIIPPPPPSVPSLPSPSYAPTVSAPQPSPVVAQPTVWGYLNFSNGMQVKLTRQRTVFGRTKPEPGIANPDVDLSSLPEGISVSHLHAALEHSGDMITVIDLRSRNGTFINGVRLEPDQPAPIRDGDTIFFGRVTCIFKKG